jgi:hypothetical protein
LFQRFCPKLWLKAACRSGNRRGLVQGALAGLLRRLSQRSAERTNARARLATLLDDQSLGKLLGFTGAE